jgi:hypothetical protein
MDIAKIIRGLLGQPEPGLKDFATYADLDAWYTLYTGLQLPQGNLCDDYSRDARLIAEMDGYFLSCELVAGGVCYQTIIFPLASDPTKPDPAVFHIGNMAVVNKVETNRADGVTSKDSSGNVVPAGTPLETCYFVDLNWRMLIQLCGFFPGGEF